jgi:hypothetical protein
MAGPTFLKDPDALLDYHIDWTAWLAGDTLAASVWMPEDPTRITLTLPGMTATHTTIWAGDGAAGDVIEATNSILTTEGRAEDRTIRFMITNR